MNIIPLSEGSFTIDNTKVFVPFNQDNDVLTERPKGSLLVEVQPFVIVTKKDIILLDTGLGFSDKGLLQIHANLLANHIKPEDVTKVLLSHLHKDHSGGIADEQHGERKLSFPNATYYVHKSELEYAIQKGKPSYHPEDFDMLAESHHLVLLEGESGDIDAHINFEISGGHCPFHIVFWIKDESKTIFFGGDEAPQLQQMKNRLIAKYDYDGKKSQELRTEWWEKSEVDKWTILFYHDIKTPYVSR